MSVYRSLRSTLRIKADRRSSFGILGNTIDDLETAQNGHGSCLPRLLSCRETGFSCDMFSNKKKDAQSITVDNRLCSKFSLPLVDWNQSQNTLVGRETCSDLEKTTAIGSFSKSSSLESLEPPPRPRRSNTTRITHSLRTMLSSTSRYASVIQFYQGSSTTTPSPSPTKQVHPTPPPGWI